MQFRKRVWRVIGRILAALGLAQALTIAGLQIVAYRRKRLRPTAHFPRVAPQPFQAVDGTEVTIYTYGRDLYADMLSAIRTATSTVMLETFIWKDDAVGHEFKQAVIEAADRGVEVYLIWDEFANLVIPQRFFKFPRGVHALPHPLVSGRLGFLHPGNLGRDHRKLLIIDSQVAWMGGYNIGSMYATDWRDTHVRFRGDIVADLENAFVDYWNMLAHNRRRPIAAVATRPWHANFRVQRNLPRHLMYPIRGMYLEAIDRATQRVWMTHAYLIPDEDMVAALIDAVGRGVDVRIIVPAESNHIEADWMARGYYRTLLENGVRLFLYQNAMVHAKTATIDGAWTTIGTANMDRLSLLGNYEINVEITDTTVAERMEQIFGIDEGNCVELTLPNWEKRSFLAKFSEVLLRPLRHFL